MREERKKRERERKRDRERERGRERLTDKGKEKEVQYILILKDIFRGNRRQRMR